MSRRRCFWAGRSLFSSFILDTLRSCASILPPSESRDFLRPASVSSLLRISLNRMLYVRGHGQPRSRELGVVAFLRRDGRRTGNCRCVPHRPSRLSTSNRTRCRPCSRRPVNRARACQLSSYRTGDLEGERETDVQVWTLCACPFSQRVGSLVSLSCETLRPVCPHPCERRGQYTECPASESNRGRRTDPRACVRR